MKYQGSTPMGAKFTDGDIERKDMGKDTVTIRELRSEDLGIVWGLLFQGPKTRRD